MQTEPGRPSPLSSARRSPVRPVLALFVLLAALAVAASALPATGTAARPGAAAAAGPARVSRPAAIGPGLARLARRAPDRRVVAIVLFDRAPNAAARSAVAAAGAQILRPLPLVDGLALRMPARAAARVARIAGVRSVTPDAPVAATGAPDPSQLASAYDASIRADRAWAMGATGAGIGVAVIDTGVAGDLPDFRVSAQDTRSRVAVSAVVNPAARAAGDTYGHGTHVAGLIAGDGDARDAGDPLGGRYVGVAPDARVIAVKADDGHGHTTILDLIDALSFVVDHRVQDGIRVVNLSVRSTVAQSARIDPLDAAVERAWRKGLVVVAAAGNLGGAADAVSFAPANDPYVLTVGAVDDRGTAAIGDDVLARWSSRGVTQDGIAKPDVVAPGAHLVSTLAPGSDYAKLCPQCVVDGAYLRLGGTSMAAAVASGAVAAVLSAHPDWTPDVVKGTLVARTRPVLGYDDTQVPVFVDADGSVEGSGVDVTTTIAQGEIALDKVLAPHAPAAPANATATPSDRLDPATGDFAGGWPTGSWGTGSWGTGSWTAATGDLVAPWATASWVGAPLPEGAFAPTPDTCTQLDRTGWSTGSWATGSWTADELDAAHAACVTAASAQTGSWGTGSWGTGSWGTGSWGTGSWGTGSWGSGSWATSFDR